MATLHWNNIFIAFVSTFIVVLLLLESLFTAKISNQQTILPNTQQQAQQLNSNFSFTEPEINFAQSLDLPPTKTLKLQEQKEDPNACYDLSETWSDVQGNTCAAYIERKLCTDTGGYGPNWNPEARLTFHHWADLNGFDASEACCSCGGGYSYTQLQAVQAMIAADDELLSKGIDELEEEKEPPKPAVYYIILTKTPWNQIRYHEIDLSLFNDGVKIGLASIDYGPKSEAEDQKIVSEVPFNQIIIRNRLDCCQEEIVGRSIKATADGGETWFVDQTFQHKDEVYFFSSKKSFVQIGLLQESSHVLNLAEMRVYSKGTAIDNTKLQCFVSGEIQNNCIDGRDDFLHSGGLAYLFLSSEEPFDEVEVVNRKDCCQYRVVGATIRATLDGGTTWSLVDTFKEELGVYKFPLTLGSN